ncbi:uncharacterized protein F5147DRAFT_667814 [Suillus discolor]|uniref:WKF domain-containing protein n=1 Tax=Suillus discolor TaxID=1912936 RepID=A0A9P7K0K8_9AGAM|nr:uncharacterized protein F5147DRAFT_667814 [Suillus discolor]KAG2119004.1 hypothetical protein F5147DRAFT_667814 [Suillus discolor]
MSVTDIGGASPKSHKKSRSADSHVKDAGQERIKSKKRKHREATSDALLMTTPKDQATSTTRDSQSTSLPLSPSSTPSAGNVASKNDQLANLTTSDTERKKKNKNYSGDVAHEQLKDRSDEPKKEKKKKKLKHSDEGKHEGAALDEQVAHLNDTKVQTPEEAASDKPQQKKKKKKRKAEEQLEETSDSKPSKRKKDHCPPDLPSTDPCVDESLSNQSRKALSYAYARFEDPPNWKFNKAKQIWLIKRLWSEEMIPEKYFALVTKYLADVKGGIRDNLIQMCNSVEASETPDPVTSESAVSPTDLSDGGSTITTKVMRARSLLGALSDVQ